jgi:hypothetical protein
MIVVGNKLDLAKKDRAVSTEEGSALADDFGASFIEVSVRKRKELFTIAYFEVLSCEACFV